MQVPDRVKALAGEPKYGHYEVHQSRPVIMPVGIYRPKAVKKRDFQATMYFGKKAATAVALL